MAKIHYFPRYSQKENMVTNNTLLLFNRLYQHHTYRFKQFINLILEDSDLELDTTVKFSQQVKATSSIPDAVIEQESFKIVIETKLYGQQNLPQLMGHLSSFSNEDKQILLWINTNPIGQVYREEIEKEINLYNQSHKTSIQFAFTTFKEICSKFKEVLNPYEVEMMDLINDFEAFCHDAHLISNHEYLMRSLLFKEICSKFKEVLNPYEVEMMDLINDFEAFCHDAHLISNHEYLMRSLLTSKTLERNFKYNLYYAPRTRNYRPHKYIGLYAAKAIRGIGEISCIIDVCFNRDTQELDIINTLQGHLTPQQKQDIINAIQEVSETEGHDLGAGDQRFFLVKQFIPCEFKKITKGAPLRTRYFDLTQVIENFTDEMSIEEIVQQLNQATWN